MERTGTWGPRGAGAGSGAGDWGGEVEGRRRPGRRWGCRSAERGWGRGRGLRGRRGGGSGYRAEGGGGERRGRGAAAAKLASSAGRLWRRRRPRGGGGGLTDRRPGARGPTVGCPELIAGQETAAANDAQPQAPRGQALPGGLTAAERRPRTGRGSPRCAEVSARCHPARPAAPARPAGLSRAEAAAVEPGALF